MYSTQTLWRPVYYKAPFLLMLVTWIWLFIIILTKEIYTLYLYILKERYHSVLSQQIATTVNMYHPTPSYPLFPMIILYSPMIILYSSVQFIKLPIFFNKRQRFFFNVNNLSNPSFDAKPFRQHLGVITFGLRFFSHKFCSVYFLPHSPFYAWLYQTLSLSTITQTRTLVTLIRFDPSNCN